MRSVREVAAPQGLDANVWIDNVERIAAARLGTTTVTYVDNIYKYYVAYKLIAERTADKTTALRQQQSVP